MTPVLFVSGSPPPRSKSSSAVHTPVPLHPVPRAASVDTAPDATSPHTGSLSASPRPLALRRIVKAVDKTWHHLESSGTNYLPPSLSSVKETKNPLLSFFKLFEGVPFFLSIYSIKILPDSIKNRDAAHFGDKPSRAFRTVFRV